MGCPLKKLIDKSKVHRAAIIKIGERVNVVEAEYRGLKQSGTALVERVNAIDKKLSEPAPLRPEINTDVVQLFRDFDKLVASFVNDRAEHAKMLEGFVPMALHQDLVDSTGHRFQIFNKLVDDMARAERSIKWINDLNRTRQEEQERIAVRLQDLERTLQKAMAPTPTDSRPVSVRRGTPAKKKAVKAK